MNVPAVAAQDSRYRLVIAALILAAHFCTGLNVFAISPVISLVTQDLDIGRTSASLLVALPLLISAVFGPVSYIHLRAHETREDIVCRLLLEKKKNKEMT